jgi:hypothetical protein
MVWPIAHSSGAPTVAQEPPPQCAARVELVNVKNKHCFSVKQCFFEKQ